MSDIKTVPITKNLLTQLPPSEEKAPKTEDISSHDAAIQEMRQQIEQLQQTVSFLATFESNLLKSFNAEIEILREAASLTQNDLQKRSFKTIAESLERIRSRWTENEEFFIDRKKMMFVRVKD